MQHAVRPCLTTAVLGAGIIAAPAAAPQSVHTAPVRLASGENIAFVIGGSGDPIPSDQYVDTNNTLYVQPNFPGYIPQALFTPEGNYALYTGVKSLTLDQSEAQGVTILKDAIEKQIAAGNHVAVLGDSQSSTISSMVMSELAADRISKDDVGFVLLADPNQPDGGLFERLTGVTIPSLGITFNGATPDDLYPTTIYMQAYDGFSDIPRYPINFLADLNSILGIQFVHPTYQDLTPEQLASAVKLDTVGDTMTTYYGIPLSDETVPYLPLLQPLLLVPGLGKPLADLLQPILTPLVNLGYGDPDFGWDTGPANVPTPFGLFPDTDMVVKAFQEAAAGVPTGIQAFTDDLGSLDLSNLSSSAASEVAGSFNLTDFVNSLTAAFSTAYAALLPTADVITGVTTTIPTYDLQWFTDGLQSGNLLEAIFQPIANNTYLYTLAAGFEAFALISTAESISADLSGLFPG
ncbi:PE-PPE domain-containing protein [Mycolicibacter terrae]|uniref:PE-PPE domain-containing protein n=1 Tax=Mycolicibacter terrae TaxID=1788 RepID=A0ACD2EQM8_9MYCO|nr:PE-PPE domain-containing protein [Mycolicibacter terrae]RRR47164.1 PE-PPE domain-containing protein [Mycolicibacter terrae]